MSNKQESLRRAVEYKNRNTFVTYRSLVASLAAIVTALVGVLVVVWQIHASQPHAGALKEKEFGRFLTSIEHRLQRIENKLDRLVISKPASNNGG